MDELTIESLSRRLARVERANRRWRWACLAALTSLACGPLTWPSGPRTESHAVGAIMDSREDAVGAVKARLELARKALAIIRAKTALGPQVSHPVEDTYRWSVLQLGAQIYLSMRPDEIKVEDPEVYLAVAECRPNEDRLRAFENHHALMRKWEDRLRPRANSTLIAPLDFMHIQEHRLQAELWLARERTKMAEADQRK